MVSVGATNWADGRSERRDEVHHRVRAIGPDGRSLNLIVVNMSPSGLMARCDADYAVEDMMRVHLPVVGPVQATIRWSLGGRVGCQLDRTIPPADYHALLAAVARS